MKKNNGGFSLIEVLVAIVILAAVVIPTCSALVLSHRLNAETDKLMKAQLAVSSAVETLMAEGISAAADEYDVIITTDGSGNVIKREDRFPAVTVITEEVIINQIVQSYYKVTVEAVERIDDGNGGSTEKVLAVAETYIRKGGS